MEVLGRVVFVGGKPGNFPLTGPDLPSHWFVYKLPCQGKDDSPTAWVRPANTYLLTYYVAFTRERDELSWLCYFTPLLTD